MTVTWTITHPTPLGQLTLAASDAGLTRVTFQAPRVTADAASTAARG
ncbi:MAG: hypothetical protein M3Z25_00115 [Actinomycetota bacterium]|nr:hypothetical protein [Actinomycetota bacterium]